MRKGSWFQRPSFGSDLHLLAREKQVASIHSTARRMVSDCLKWLTDSGRLENLTISTSIPRSGTLLISIQGESADKPVAMDYFVPVGAPLEA